MARGQPLDHEEDPPRSWPRRQRDIGYIAWASFLMACAATVVFFAMVDPEVLSGTTTPGWEISREAGYAIGFFGFWLLTTATAIFSIWLVRSEPRPPVARAPGSGGQQKYRQRRGGQLRRRIRPTDASAGEDRP